MPTGNYDISNPRLVGPLSLSTASLTGFASAVTGASWALTATTVPDGAAHRVTIQNNSANSKAAINITVVGTDANGNVLSETLAGPAGSATVTTAGYFKALTSVTPASTWGADTGNIGYAAQIQTAFLNINVLAEDALAVNVDISGTINYTVQQTFDDLNAASPVWQTLVSAGSQTADGIWNTTGGATGLRVTVNSYSAAATIRVNANPTAMVNAPGAGGGSGGGGADVDIVAVGGTAVGSALPVAASPYPNSSTPLIAGSGNVANASAAATLTGTATTTVYISGFEVTGAGATVGLPVTVTVAGLLGGTRSYTYTFAAGALLPNQPLIVEFNPPLPASAVNTAIVVTCPASGTGGTNNTTVAHGYYL